MPLGTMALRTLRTTRVLISLALAVASASCIRVPVPDDPCEDAAMRTVWLPTVEPSVVARSALTDIVFRAEVLGGTAGLAVTPYWSLLSPEHVA